MLRLIEEFRIEIRLPRLLFLGALVVVDGVQAAAGVPATKTEKGRRLSTVTPDFQAGAQSAGLSGQFIETERLIFR